MEIGNLRNPDALSPTFCPLDQHALTEHNDRGYLTSYHLLWNWWCGLGGWVFITRSFDRLVTTTLYTSSNLAVFQPTNGSLSLCRYSQSSFTLTQKASASLSFSFNGTGVQIYGAKRSNHGIYQISIDATTYPQVNGSVSDQPGQFQTSLFSTVALINGLHNVTMTNLGSTFLDVDFVSRLFAFGSLTALSSLLTKALYGRLHGKHL